MKKHLYLTTKQYGPYPIGSKCFAFRIFGGTKLLVEFMDGNVIELNGGDAYLKGLVSHPWMNEVHHDLIPLHEGDRSKESAQLIQEWIMELKEKR
jgi:hypothetical protein